MERIRNTGVWFIVSVIAVLIPYFLLTVNFRYPGILRQDAGSILEAVHEGGSSLIFTWLAFALSGLPLLIAYVQTGQLLKTKIGFMHWVTVIGVLSIIVQCIGLLRWVFVVPVLAADYSTATEPSTRAAILVIFKVVHQWGGVLLGEHLGQLFTVIWTFMSALALKRLKILPAWLNFFGMGSALIYLLAQAELLATVIPAFPQFPWSGFVGSTLWLIWLAITGWQLYRRE